MRKWIIAIFLGILIVGGLFFYIYWNGNQNDGNNYEAERTSTSKENATESPQNKEQKGTEEQSQSQPQAETQSPTNPPVEAEELSAFSTKIYTKESARQNNVTITCNTLNDTDIPNGETFSFCNTVGRASPSQGYKKADIFTNGKKTKGYGGGNCQVSTTLYNAVLPVPNLNITERHEHSNKVPYIQSGKDSAVAFGSYDLKFVNNTGFTIRIKAENTPDAVTIRLIKLI